MGYDKISEKVMKFAVSCHLRQIDLHAHVHAHTHEGATEIMLSIRLTYQHLVAYTYCNGEKLCLAHFDTFENSSSDQPYSLRANRFQMAECRLSRSDQIDGRCDHCSPAQCKYRRARENGMDISDRGRANKTRLADFSQPFRHRPLRPS